MSVSVPIENIEVNAKFLYRNGFYSEGYANQKMSKVRQAINQRRISLECFCDFYKLDIRMFRGMK